MDSYLPYIGLAVTIGSFCFAIWKGVSQRKLKDFIRLDAIELYRDTGMMLGAIQDCLGAINGNYIELAASSAGKTEGMAQALFQRSIKNIAHHFNYSTEIVDSWIEKKKIDSHHQDDFLKYAEK